jgi:uncharacterized protein (TIGR00297 family)
MGSQSLENRRQWVHFSMVGFCLLLRWFDQPQAAGMALAAVAFNFFLLPLVRFGRDLSREKEPFLSGLKFYPIAVFLAILAFPLPLAAAAWGILAAGDCFSNLVGRAWGRTKLPWNRKKSVAGSVAFVLTAFPTAWFFGWWASAGHPESAYGIAQLALLAAAGSIVAAVLEGLPIPIDDNLSVTLGGGFVMAAIAGAVRDDVLVALGVNAVVAGAAWLAQTVSASGALAGLGVGTIVWVGTGWRGYLLLVTFFVLGSLATKHRYSEKAARGIEEKGGGARGAKNALAKGAVAVACAVGHLFTGHPLFLYGFASAIATALSDTASSELGKVYGKHPILITTLKRVPPGTEGAVSIEGTLFGIAASAVVAALAVGLGLLEGEGVAGGAIVIAAAFVGTTFESYLGAAIQGFRGISNEMVNVFLTLVGAGVGIGLKVLL